MLLLYSGPDDFDDVSPDEMQRIIERYRAWGESLRRSGHFLASDKLKDGEGRVLRRQAGRTRVLDGPFSETKEIVGGYYSVKAADYEEAVRLCEECPHLDFGVIEVRQVDELD
jgi:hypothetical protein